MIPSWLITPPPLPQAHKPSHGSLKEVIDSCSLKDNKGDFMRRFTNCSDVDSLRRLTAEAGVELRAYSRLAFRQLLKANQPIDSLLQFLQDPALNDPKAKNLRFFLDWQSRRSGNNLEMKHTIHHLAPWIKQQLGLGMMRGDEVEHLVMLLNRLARQTQNERLVPILAGAIVIGLEECRVMSISDLQGSTIQEILNSLLMHDLTQRKAILINKILEGLNRSQMQHMGINICRFIIGICRVKVRREVNAGTAATSLDLEGEFARILSLVPDTIKLQVIDSTSIRLMERVARDHDHRVIWSTALKIWYFHLVECGLFSIMDGSNKSDTPRFVGHRQAAIFMPYLRHLDDEGIALHLLRHWWRAPRRLQKEYTQGLLQSSGGEPFSPMLKLAQDGLPGHLKPQLVEKLFEVLLLMRRHGTIVEIVEKASQRNILLPTLIMSSLVRAYVPIEPYYARRIYRSTPGLLMEHCPALAESMINNIKLHPNTLWRYLRHRRPARMSEADYQRWREDRARLFERMAYRYSKAPHLSPRMAFRYVYMCYTHHKKDRLGPVGESLSRSITRTGLIRQLQRKQWVSSVKLRWILSIVRASEGDEVADKVDRLVYKWRKEHTNGRELMRRLERLREARKGPMVHLIQNRWSWRKRRPVKLFTPIQNTGISLT